MAWDVLSRDVLSVLSVHMLINYKNLTNSFLLDCMSKLYF